MTVHMFRAVAAQPDGITEAQANQIVEQWLMDNTPWTEDPVPHELSLVDDPLTDAPVHFRGDVRFEASDDKVSLLDQIETDLSGIAPWYRIGYHACSHDEDNAHACSWDQQREGGTVPDSIPEFTH